MFPFCCFQTLFFFLLNWDDPRTPSAHPVFGECADKESYEVVLKIERTPTDMRDKPREERKILKAEVIDE